MNEVKNNPETISFLKSLGFPSVRVHHSFNHFDFSRPDRRILVIGPMGSGKTEYSARVWRDAQVALTKSETIARETSTDGADRRKVFLFVRYWTPSDFPIIRRMLLPIGVDMSVAAITSPG